jgi:putative dimethyl sulfoxide reductase chaperone
MTVATTDREALAALLDNYGAACGVLSRVFVAPADAELIRQLTDADMLSSWPMAHDEHTSRGLGLLIQSAERAESIQLLEADYYRLFVGPEPMKAPPYESVYLTRDHLIFDEPTRQVRAAYAEFALAAPKLNREPDDHLGLEFDFLAQLCVTALDAIDLVDETTMMRSLDAQRRFLTDHLQRWAGSCLQLAEEHAETRFYQGAAALGLGVLEQSAVFTD